MFITLGILLMTISGIHPLDCNGPAEVVIAVPGSQDVPESEFIKLEEFLIQLTSFYNISSTNTRVGLVIYGREPVVIAGLEDAPTSRSLNTRISLLSQRVLYTHSLSGGQDIPKAIDRVHSLLSTGRSGVPRIGLIMTYGQRDLSSVDPATVRRNIALEADAARADGVHLFATSTNGVVPGFVNITSDTCRLYSLGGYSGLGSLLPYLASSTCYVLDQDVVVTPSNCFPEVAQPPPSPVHSVDCQPQKVLIPDPTNCAYFYQCPREERIRCPSGLVFDPIAKSCNHKEFVFCYSGLVCPSLEGQFPHPKSCSKYILCSQNIPYVIDCPNGLFSTREGHCDYKENSICNHGYVEKLSRGTT